MSEPTPVHDSLPHEEFEPFVHAVDEVIEYHPATEAILRYFEFDHLPAGPLRETSRSIASAAYWLSSFLPQGPELTAGLRKLLEAKDCFVRQALDLLDEPQNQEAR